MLASIIVVFCWLVFLIYWGVSSRSLKPTKEIRINFHGKWRIVILAIVVLFLLLRHFGLPLPFCQPDLAGCHFHLLSGSNRGFFLWQLAASILVISGLAIAIVARKTIGSNWSNNIDIKENHQLITTGIYSYVRHPIYSGVLLMVFANLIISTSFITTLVNLALVVFFVYKLNQEEIFLTKHFPKEYPAYKKRVKALIPFII